MALYEVRASPHRNQGRSAPPWRLPSCRRLQKGKTKPPLDKSWPTSTRAYALVPELTTDVQLPFPIF